MMQELTLPPLSGYTSKLASFRDWTEAKTISSLGSQL